MTKPYTLNPIRYVCCVIFILTLCASLTGCGPAWKKKFVRKRAPQETEPVFTYEPQDYRKEENIELYKKHFIFWKAWHEELITRLGNNKAADIRAFEEALKDLSQMRNCLKEEKAGELDTYTKKLEDFFNTYKTEDLDIVRANQMRGDLDRLMLKMDKLFRLTKVKDYIK